MATTTALIVGLTLSELMKVGQKISDLGKYRAMHINTALNTYWIIKVEKAEIVKGEENDEVLGYPTIAVPEGFTEWGKIEIKGPMTIEQVVKHIQNTYNVETNVITSGELILYRKYSKQRAKLLKMEVERRFEEAAERKLEREKYLELSIEGFIKKEDVKLKALMPKFKYVFKS